MPSKKSRASRYDSQVRLPGFGAAAQAKLAAANVLIVGAGGLGCPAAAHLAAAGIGHLAIADYDAVAASNLHRQTLYTPDDVGQLKVEVAAKALRRQNPDITIEPINCRVTASNVLELIEPFDLVLDCTDNFAVRYVLNDGCVLAGKTLVYGAAYQFGGQVAVWNAQNKDGSRSPHLRDVFPEDDGQAAMDCQTGGVLPTLTGIIGAMEANEAIKYLAGLPGLLSSQLLVFDAKSLQSRIIKLQDASTTLIEAMASELPEITVEQLRAALPSKRYQLVDVRTPAEHSQFNIGGQLLPLNEIMTGRYELAADQPVVFYCATGNRSLVAAQMLMQRRPGTTALSLAGGVVAWQQSA